MTLTRTKKNYRTDPRPCAKCGRTTINDETTWVTSNLRVHQDTLLMICDKKGN